MIRYTFKPREKVRPPPVCSEEKPVRVVLLDPFIVRMKEATAEPVKDEPYNPWGRL